MEPSGSEKAKVIEEYMDAIWPIGLSHLGSMAKKAFLRPGSVRTSVRSASGPKATSSLSMKGAPCAIIRVHPREGRSWPDPQKGASRMCSYDAMVSKGMLPSKEKTKLPLLRACMLQRPALSGIGRATALDMFSFTSRTIASAVLPRIWFSSWMSQWPPWRTTVTSVIKGEAADVFGVLLGCWAFGPGASTLVDVAALAYDCGVRFMWVGGTRSGSPLFFFLLRRLVVMKFWLSPCASSTGLVEAGGSLALLWVDAAGCINGLLSAAGPGLVAGPRRGGRGVGGGGMEVLSSASRRDMSGVMAALMAAVISEEICWSADRVGVVVL
jgi:hypothetical protein